MNDDQVQYFKDTIAEQGYKIVPSVYVSDTAVAVRSWKERLFSLPWNPRLKYKNVYHPMALYLGKDILVSYKTYAILSESK